MSSTYTSFAIYGASGNLGTHIVSSFLAKGVRSLILTRKITESSERKTFPAGVTVAQVDISSASDVASALKEHKVEVLISVIGSMAIPSQNVFVDAVKEAGCAELFVPSEFGSPSVGIEEGFQAGKNAVAKYAKSQGVHTAQFFTGVFTEWATWPVGFDVNGKVNAVGETDVPFTLTSLKDVGGYVAHVLTTLSKDRLRDSTFRIQGDCTTLEGLAALLKTEIVKTEKVPGEMGELKTTIQSLMNEGVGSTGWDQGKKMNVPEMASRDNGLWEGHEWLKIKDVLEL